MTESGFEAGNGISGLEAALVLRAESWSRFFAFMTSYT